MNTAPLRSRKGSLFVWGALAVVILLVVIFGILGKPAEKKVEVVEKPYPVRIEVIEPRTVPDEIPLPGLVMPLKEAELSAEKAGRVVEVKVDQGTPVKTGEVLLRLDGRAWEAQLRRAEVESRDAERDLKRYKELEKTGAVSASDFEAIERRRDMANIARDEAQVFLSQCEVRAPFDGTVNERLVGLIQTDRVKVGFDVPEQDIAAVKPGDSLTYTLSALSDRVFTGEVTFVSGRAARESNSFHVEIENGNPDGVLKAGMITQVWLVRRLRPDAVVVPMAAVVPRKGEHMVFIVENDRAVRRRVIIEALIGSQAVLSDGLAAGESLVVEGHRGLQDGMRVEVVPPDADAASEQVQPREP
jgi:membrane fusion protein (multidrug efflux system)